MKTLIVIIVLLLSSITLMSQTPPIGSPPISYVLADPSGSCYATAQALNSGGYSRLQVNILTGSISTCIGGTWSTASPLPSGSVVSGANLALPGNLSVSNGVAATTGMSVGKQSAITSPRVQFQPYENNPVVNTDNGIESSVLMVGSTAHVWYRRSNSTIYHATATDTALSNWTTSVAVTGATGYYPYVTVVAGTYYMVTNSAATHPGALYLYSSTDGLTWTACNGGNPILSPSATTTDWTYILYNPALAVVGSTAYLAIDGATVAGSDWSLGASTAVWNPDSISFATNLTHVTSTGTNKQCCVSLLYVPSRSGFIAAYNYGWYLRTSDVPLAHWLESAYWVPSANFSHQEFFTTGAQVDLSDIALVDVGSGMRSPLMIQYNHDQTCVTGVNCNTLYQAWGPPGLTAEGWWDRLAGQDPLVLPATRVAGVLTAEQPVSFPAGGVFAGCSIVLSGAFTNVDCPHSFVTRGIHNPPTGAALSISYDGSNGASFTAMSNWANNTKAPMYFYGSSYAFYFAGSATTLVCWKADGRTLGYATMSAGNISACN